MKRKGFTLVELLVVIAIIALLMGILMPALARVRQIAHRLVCGTNLSGLGKAMLIYANEREDEFPRAGYRDSTYTSSLGANWSALARADAYSGGVTVASSLYLLVKYVDVGPKQFLCKGTDTTEFKPGDYVPGLDLIEVWDFGDKPEWHCSYSYHSPHDSRYALNIGASPPGMAVAADRNPWLDPANTDPEYPFIWNSEIAEERKAGNALAHGNEGQQVLFRDGHVTFERWSFCGVQDDNIYTRSPKASDTVFPQQGDPPVSGGVTPWHREDSLLVNEGREDGDGTDTDDR